MVSIRRASAEDLIQMQMTNLLCLPENYQFKYYAYHYLSWPCLLHVAENSDKKIVGYVLAKLEEDEDNPKLIQGHITSISILRTYRKLGIATKLMQCALNMMTEYFSAGCVSLNVRVTNRAALHMYKEVLKFEITGKEVNYYADKEDAYKMTRFFQKNVKDEMKNLKIIELKDEVDYEEIKGCFEEVDVNGEEKIDSNDKEDDSKP